MTEIRLSIQPMEHSGNSVSPKGPTAECCSVLLLQNALGQRSPNSQFTSTLFYLFYAYMNLHPKPLVIFVYSFLEDYKHCWEPDRQKVTYEKGWAAASTIYILF